MTAPLQNLPVGIQSFADLRGNGYLYVDKTELVHRLVSTGKTYFLSRPRRFGKSLLVSTLEALFLGQKEFFKDLWIEDKWDWSKSNPVIRLDFGSLAYRTAEMLTNSLRSFVDQQAKKLGVQLETIETSQRFSELIEKIHETTGRQVVVLVDEYDKAIVDHLGRPEIADANREILRDFYQVLKSTDEHLRFIFLTGVTRFTKVSLFSGLNSPKDITLHPAYGTLCGYTQAELEQNFEAHLQAMAERQEMSMTELLSEIKVWYNGFSWDGKTSVYNPYSTLQLLDTGEFRDYWFATGSSKFLVDLLKERDDVRYCMEESEVDPSSLDNFEVREIPTQVLMFQTGYLTVKSVRKSPFDASQIFTLAVPNQEVKQALMKHLVSAYSSQSTVEVKTLGFQMKEQLVSGNCALFEERAQALFARIPTILRPKEPHAAAQYVHSLLLLWLNLLGFDARAEENAGKGRIDAVWQWKDRVVVCEVKYSAQKSTDELLAAAMKQMKEKRYAAPYLDGKRKVSLLAVAFAEGEVRCEMEPYGTTTVSKSDCTMSSARAFSASAS
jgi:hypothetical protein